MYDEFGNYIGPEIESDDEDDQVELDEETQEGRGGRDGVVEDDEDAWMDEAEAGARDRVQGTPAMRVARIAALAAALERLNSHVW